MAQASVKDLTFSSRLSLLQSVERVSPLGGFFVCLVGFFLFFLLCWWFILTFITANFFFPKSSVLYLYALASFTLKFHSVLTGASLI